MNKESIIREWFYRLPKGYAEPPYSKVEMDTLHEVLNENGLNGSVFITEDIDTGPKRNFKPYGDKYTEFEKTTNPELKEMDIVDQGFLDAKPVEDLTESPVQDFQPIFDKIKAYPEFASYEPDRVTNKSGNWFFVYFKSFLPRGDRSILYNVFNEFADQDNEINIIDTNPKLVKFEYNGTPYQISFKGSGGTATSTDVKEDLVVAFHAANIIDPITTENFIEVKNNMLNLLPGLRGLSTKGKDGLIKYFEEATISKPIINILNDSLSSAAKIAEAYPGNTIIRSGDFDDVRRVASKLTGYPADKWCPGDVYVVTGDIGRFLTAAIQEDEIAAVNKLFNNEWGSTNSAFTAVSLKQEKAQGGKAKSYLKRYLKDPRDTFNLTPEEKDLSFDEKIQQVINLREKLKSLMQGTKNLSYEIENEGADVLAKKDDSHLIGKMAALKSLEFLFRNYVVAERDDAIVHLAAFAMSMTGVNPTFWKVIGNKSGTGAAIEKFEAGMVPTLHINDSAEWQPIIISDTLNYGGLKIDFELLNGTEIFKVLLNARNNGMTQGTIEIGTIKKIGDD